MTDAVETAAEPPERKRGILIPLIAAVILGGGGFASTFLGFWSPAGLFQPAPQKTAPDDSVAFVDIPAIEMTMPGTRARSVILAASLEVAAADRGAVESLMPRILDAMNGFLSEVDPGAYDKRGVLEIIRAELTTRIRNVLGDTAVKDLLITEFRIK